MMGTTAASGVMQARQQQMQNDMVERNFQIRQDQQEQAAAQKAFERSREARRERARIRATAGEAGVGGNSVGLQLADSRFQESMAKGAIYSNEEMQNQNARMQAKSQMQSPEATLLKTGLSVGSTYAGGLNQPGGG